MLGSVGSAQHYGVELNYWNVIYAHSNQPRIIRYV